MGDKIVLVFVAVVIAIVVAYHQGGAVRDAEWERGIRQLGESCRSEWEGIVKGIEAADESTHARHRR